MIDQNLEVKRILNVTTVAKKDTSNKSVGITKREERAKNLSHQMLRGVASISEDGKILYGEATTVSKSRKRLYDVWVMDSGAT